MTRLDLLNNIIDNHIECLAAIEDPELVDTKKLTEILRSILIVEQIKKLEGSQSEFDSMTNEELDSRIEGLSE